jgi:hypothetical protein
VLSLDEANGQIRKIMQRKERMAKFAAKFGQEAGITPQEFKKQGGFQGLGAII